MATNFNDSDLFAAPEFGDADLFGQTALTPPGGSVDPNLKDFVKGQEGFSQKPYGDFKQTSVGFGTRYRPGQSLDRQTLENDLDRELGNAAAEVDRFAPNAPPGVKKALTDLTFNAGTAWQTAGLGEAIKRGDYVDAAQRFVQYNKAGGRPLPGLTARRQALSSGFTDSGGQNVQVAGNLSDNDILGLTGGGSQESNANGPFPDPRVATQNTQVLQERAPNEAAAPTTPLEEPTVGTYASEAGKAFVQGAKDLGSSALVGIGAATANDERLIAERAQELIVQQGLDPYEALQQAKAEKPHRSIEEDPIVQAGRSLQNFGKEALAPREDFNESWTRDIASGAGSLVGGIGLGLINPGIAGTTFLGSGMGEAYDTAIKKGATPEQAQRAAQLGTIAGATDLADLIFISTGSAGKAMGLLKKVGEKALKGAFIEGGQEGFQQFIQNLIAMGVYNPDQDLREDVPRSAVVGAILGGGAGAVHGGLVREHTTSTRPTADQVGEFFQDITKDLAPVTEGMPPVEPPTPPGPNPDAVLFEEKPQTEPTNVVASESGPTKGPIFVSKLRQTVEDALPERASPAQILNTLRGKVKEEELVDTGLLNYLNKQDGPVTKQDIRDFLLENAIQIKETLLTGPGEDVSNGPTQYDQYKTPGPHGGYFELLMRLPAKETERGLLQPGENYIAGHFVDERSDSSKDRRTVNLLAHTRFTQRTDVNGIETLHVEEIQSDWHQEAKKEGGYRDPNEIPRIRRLLDAYSRKERELSQRIRMIYDAKDLRNDASEHQRLRIMENQRTDIRYEMSRLDDELNNAYGKVPDAPFKKSWDTLVARRLIRWAADRGISRITLAPGWEQLRRYPGMINNMPSQATGLAKYYDEKLPNILKAEIKRLGGTWGTTKIETGGGLRGYAVRDANGNIVSIYPTEHAAARFVFNENRYPGNNYTYGPVQFEDRSSMLQEVPYFDIPASATTAIQQGLPMYSHAGPEFSGKPKLTINIDAPLRGHSMFEPAVKLVQALQDIANQMNLGTKVRFNLIANSMEKAYGWIDRYPDVNGVRTITINVPKHRSVENLWSTMTHEFGHLVFFEKFAKADTAVQEGIINAYTKWREQNSMSTPYFSLILGRDSANGPRMRLADRIAGLPPGPEKAALENFTVEQTDEKDYWLSFDEWVAEQVARWASTDAKPLSVVDKFFKGIAKTLKELISRVSQRFGLSYEADKAVSDWLNSFMQRRHFEIHDLLRAIEEKAKKHDQALLDKGGTPQVTAVRRQPETFGPRQLIRWLKGKGEDTQELERMAVETDRFNWVYKWGLNLIQIAARNPHIAELQAYRETVQQLHLHKQKVMAAAHAVLKQLQALGHTQETAVHEAMFELDRMEYRTDKEKEQGISRQPTQAEFDALVKKHGLTVEGLKALNSVRRIFDTFLQLNEQNAIESAQRTITDPVKLADTIDSIRSNFRSMRNKPYFPHLQFGEHYVVIRDAAGKVLYIETVERRGFKSAEKVQDDLYRQLGKTLAEGETIQKGKWTKDARPMLGMPKAMLDLMAEKMDLSDAQRDQLELLRFEMAPAQSFRHRFQRRKNIQGYSLDFRRSFATYFFHGANFYANTKFIDHLRGFIKALDASTKEKGPDGELLRSDVNNRKDIVNFLHDHLQNTIDPKTEWAALRALTFIWALGYSPAAAALNLTQLPIATYPYLAAHFGDAKATAAMTRAGTNISTYYKKGTLNDAAAQMTDMDLKALDEAIKEGVLTEAMAPHLAGVAQGNNLLFGEGGKLVQRGLVHFMEKAAWMFEMTEQMNRRITFRAAWKLALENPNAKFVQETLAKNQLQFSRLKTEGWTDHHAAAFIAAKEAVEQTQYVYAQYARPRFMRGKAGTILMFKMFVQNTLFMLWNNPSVAIRSLIVMGMMGGLMGLPGADDMKEIIRVLAYQLFGKDFDVEREARRLIIDLGNGNIPPDLILHGMARRGMGFPVAADAVGGMANVTDPKAAWERFSVGRSDKPHVPVPIFDWSRSVGMGSILPVQLGELFGPPNKDQNQVMSDQIQRASGAAFGVFFNLYKAVTDTSLPATDPKRWERAVPRAFAAASKAFRVGYEGRERTRSGATLQNYDVRDTEQMAEVIGMAMGFNPLRSSAQWDRVIAEREAQGFWDISRQMLLQQYGRALSEKSKEGLEKVQGAIRKFNTELPESARGKAITPDSIKQSVQSRARSIGAQERGVPRQKGAIGTARDIQSLFPESTVDVRKVP